LSEKHLTVSDGKRPMAASPHERAAPKSLGATARIQVGHPGFTTFLPMIASPPRATGVRPRRPPAAGRNAKGLETVSLTGGLNAKTRREKIRGTAAALEGITGRVYADPAKALVVSYIGQLVGDGYAEWSLLDNGDVELRFFSGEVLLLADSSIARVV
jgi:hypothetical protein